MKPAVEAFSFQLRKQNKGLLSQSQRFAWIFQLHRSLISLHNDYDILHVHILWWGSLLLGLWSRLWKKTVFYETVLLDSDTPSGILHERFGGLKLWLLKKFHAILAINDFLAQDYLDHGFSQEQVFLLPNCVDTELFHPAANQEEKRQLRKKLGLPSEAFLLLFVGRLIQRKGFES
jgi:glycosyltransferase involved in cell wall biosynthesis